MKHNSIIPTIRQVFDINYWKKFLFSSPNRKRLTENFLSLSVLQGLNYLLPLITLPYLVRILGPDKYGLIAFAQAFIAYFGIITDYGFNLSATREISIQRENKKKISAIFSSVMIIKVGLLFLSFIIMNIIIFSFQKFRQEWLLYYLTFGMVLGQVLFPVWFFQGMERMKYITYLNITARLIFTVAIFVFIHQASDYIYVPFLNFMGSLVAGVLSLWIVFKNFNVNFKLPSVADIKHQLREGWHIFISQAAISGYTSSRLFAVGLFTDNTITGYYAIAEKLMSVVQTFPLASLVQSLYPRLSNIYSESKERARSLMNRFQNLTTIIYLIGLPIIYFLAPLIIKVIAGEPYPEVILAFRLLLFAVFFINANAFRVHFLLVSGKDSVYSRIHIIMGIGGFILTFLMTYFFSFIGTVISLIAIEFIILILTVKYSK
jgi:PST family polysaccharide transporter